HARNLDWFTENNALSLHSCIFLFQRQGETVFKTVGWPGFIGVLSGNRPGAFTITLNAVSSNEPPEINPPVSFLLRDVLDQESHFEGARQCLANAPIACDCLLLLSGTEAHEKVVIERTPSRHAIRESQEAFIVVTNDYKVLEYRRSEEELLASTSCQRFDQACLRLFDGLPKTLEDCVTILQDAAIQMEITVQQMAFENASGRHLALKTYLDNDASFSSLH
ncbi:MAG: carcinine hydrolase/isopenicillin-N N-acyltransferase family protein, partial [Salibacteraceae bacterium]